MASTHSGDTSNIQLRSSYIWSKQMEQLLPPEHQRPHVIRSAADARRFLGEGGICGSGGQWVIRVKILFYF